MTFPGGISLVIHVLINIACWVTRSVRGVKGDRERV